MSQVQIKIETDLPPLPLPEGVESKFIAVNDLLMHFLDSQRNEVSSSGTKAPLIVLVHGFPELAYSWRKIMRPLADLGYRVVAVDHRGFGRTVPNPAASNNESGNMTAYPYTYEGPLAPFNFTNRARDIVAFVNALGYERVACIMGHDSGVIAASLCALIRPDLFRSVVLMSAPFVGMPGTPFDLPAYATLKGAIGARGPVKPPLSGQTVDKMLSSLDPPKMYYQHYYSLPQANEQMHGELSPSEMRNFIRAYFHIKSACWPDSSPSPDDVKNFTTPRVLDDVEEIACLPPYYMLRRGQSMPATIGAYLPHGEDLERSCAWLSEVDVNVYATEFYRTGFQGGLNRYRVATGLGRATDTLASISASDEDYTSELTLFTQKKIEIPALFVAGEKDWGPFQQPGALDKMRKVCPLMKEGDKGIVFIKDAGHWVQQEKPDDLLVVLKEFLKDPQSQK